MKMYMQLCAVCQRGILRSLTDWSILKGPNWSICWMHSLHMRLARISFAYCSMKFSMFVFYMDLVWGLFWSLFSILISSEWWLKTNYALFWILIGVCVIWLLTKTSVILCFRSCNILYLLTFYYDDGIITSLLPFLIPIQNPFPWDRLKCVRENLLFA